MKYKESKYNLEYVIEDSYVITNIYSDNSIRVELEKKDKLKTALKNADIILDTNLRSFLINKGFLVKDDKQAVNDIKNQYINIVNGKDVLTLNIMITYDCNFRCNYCFQENKKGTKISETVINNIYKFLEKELSKYKKLYVEWFGGEALLYKDTLIEINSNIKNICKLKQVPYISRITTNGYELDLSTFKRLLRTNLFSYYITLDGIKDIHDKQRIYKDGNGTFEKIISNLLEIKNNIKSSIFNIKIRVNVSNMSFPYLQEFLDLYDRTFGDDKRFILDIAQVRDWGSNVNEFKEDIITSNKVIDYMKKSKSKTSLKMAKKGIIKQTFFCQAPQKNGYIILYDGTIHKCVMALENENFKNMNKIGYLTDNGEIIIDLNKEEKWVISKNSSKCEKCIAFPICMGLQCIYHKYQLQEKCSNIKSIIIDNLVLYNKDNLDNIEKVNI